MATYKKILFNPFNVGYTVCLVLRMATGACSWMKNLFVSLGLSHREEVYMMNALYVEFLFLFFILFSDYNLMLNKSDMC